MKFNIAKVKKCTISLLFLSFLAIQASGQMAILKGPEWSIISKTAELPKGSSLFYTSGLTASALTDSLEDGNYEKYGNTEEQSLNILEKIKVTLEEEGLKLSDVFAMKVFVSADSKTGEYDFKGWNNAYKKYFGTDDNPSKPVRATVGVATLVNPHKFIEIEVIAAKI